MSYSDDSASEYWDVPSEDQTNEAQVEETPQAPPFDPSQYVPVEQFQQTQQQLQQMQQGLSQALGQQPQGPEWDPEGAKVADKYLESKGYMTQEAYRAERANEIAQEAGYLNNNHLVSAFDNMFFDAQSKGNTQLEAELTKIGQAYQAGNIKGAIKQFQALQGRTQAPIQNQTFGHQPSQQQAQRTQFANKEDFNAWLVQQTPEKYREVMQAWEKGQTPYPIN